MQIKHVLAEQTPAAGTAAPAQQATPGAVKNVQQAVAQTKGQQTQGQLNVQALKQLLPGVDGTKLSQAIMAVKSGAMTAAHYQILGMAFQQLVQADPATTTKVMNVLKRVQQEPVAEAGVMDYAKAIGSKMTGGAQGQTIGQTAALSASSRQVQQLGATTAKTWANKELLLKQQALKQLGGAQPSNPRAPIDPGIYKAKFEDFVDKVMFRGDMDILDSTSQAKIKQNIDAIVAAQGNQAAAQKLFSDLALSALTARTTKPGTAKQQTAQTAQTAQSGEITPQSVEAELNAQGVKITPTISALQAALTEPRIRGTSDPRANALLQRFGYKTY